jgi:hypothetical protein
MLHLGMRGKKSVLHQMIEEMVEKRAYTVIYISKKTKLSEKTIRSILAKKVKSPRNKTAAKLVELYFSDFDPS